MDRVDEKLASARVRTARVGHRQRHRLVRQLSGVLILDGAAGGATGASAGAHRLFRVGASKLNHEVWNDAVKVQAVVKTLLGEVQKIAGRQRHLVHEELDGKVAE